MSFTQRLLSPVVEVRKGETSALLLMFLYSFLAMTSYNIVKPLTRAQFIQDLGADNLPVVLLFSGVLVGFIMTGYSRVASWLPPKSVIAMTQAAMAAMLLGFWVMFRGGLPNVSVAFYFVGQILGVLLISQFWTLANDVYDPRQAKRLFGFIGGGASLGGMTGSAPTDPEPVAQAGPGDAIGAYETLAGLASGTQVEKLQLTVTAAGSALQIEREELFDLLGQRPDLLQQIFAAIFNRRAPAARVTA